MAAISMSRTMIPRMIQSQVLEDEDEGEVVVHLMKVDNRILCIVASDVPLNLKEKIKVRVSRKIEPS